MDREPASNNEYLNLINLVLEKEKLISRLQNIRIVPEEGVGLTPLEQIRYATIGINCYRREVEMHEGVLYSVYGVGRDNIEERR